ncbi:hypothetical protein WG915_02040 [Corynebacterium sp. H128]|uniref:hypothetical protein n=1 Tax=Corynebacterium sp. H128 TaxID=3133427 RepID=UPI0030B76DE4
MPEIIFDVLVPESEITSLLARFEKLASTMKLTALLDGEAVVAAEVAEQLRAQVEGDADDYRMARYVVHAPNNLNHTAMTFARLLTPHADLPAEPALLENEQEFEIAADYPWVVEIRP